MAFANRIKEAIRKGPPEEQTISNALIQGMSNIMKTYPGHTLDHFFGNKPMMASQFFALHAQLIYEDEKQNDKQKKAQEKAERNTKRKRGR